MIQEIQSFFKIDDRLCALAEQAEERCKPVFAAIDQRAAYNGAKVLKAALAMDMVTMVEKF